MPLSATFDLTLLNGTNGSRMTGAGFPAVASAGDVNGDGYADLIIGAYASGASGRSSAGASYVVFGKATGWTSSFTLSTLNGSNGFRLDGAAVSDFSGRSVASAGDVNGDGYADLIIGADGADPGGHFSAGSSYVVFGKASGWAATLDLGTLNGSTGFRLDGTANYDTSGYSVASAGDVNGDGYADLIIGAYAADPSGHSSAGSSYVVFGKAGGWAASLDLSTLNGSTGFRLDGVASGDSSGRSVASAGDVNGDGYADLIIGACYADPGGRTNAGSGYVVFGKAGGWAASLDLGTLNGSDGFRLDGVAGGDLTGYSVASAGDVNGDGYADMLIGAIYAAPGGHANAGSSYVVFGKASGWAASLDLSTLNGTDGFRLDGVASGEYSGRSVASAGDLNGDGYADLIIGANYASPTGRVGAGASYVIYGKAGGWAATFDLGTLNGSDGYRIDGRQGEYTGKSVAAAGDVNGDGYADLLSGGNNSVNLVFGEPVVAVTRSGTADANFLTGGELDDSLQGLGGNDTLFGFGGNDTLAGGDGNDSLDGGAGNDTMDGGLGDDVFYVQDSGDVVIEAAGQGWDQILTSITFTLPSDVEALTLRSGFGAINALGNAADNWLIGNEANNVLEGGDGNDTLVGGDGNDTLYGGNGNDSLTGGFGNSTLDGGDGNDTLVGSTGNMLLDGGAGNDSLLGGAGSNTLSGGDGNDTLMGSGGNDTMYGGAGDDSLIGGMGDSTLDGGDGNDTLLGVDAYYVMRGGSGNDSLTGGGWDDTLYGDNGDDTLDGGAGADTLYGGAGNDSLRGGAYDDWLYGDAGNDTLDGGDGYDVLDGGDGNDSLVGGALDDALYGGTGDDTLDGGDGLDALYGGAGNDSLAGGNGNDWLEGGDGADTLDGGLGDDNLFGGGGADILLGGLGMDTLDGGGGIDTAVYGFASTGALTRNADGSWSVAKAGGETDHLIGIERVQFSDTTVVIRQPSSTDMTGDGFGDVLLQNATTGDVYLWGLDGTGLTKSGFVGWTPGADWRAAGTGDANGDGIADVLLQNTATGDCYLWALDGTTDGAGSVIASASGFVGWTPGAQWRAVGMADFNGDGLADALLQNSETGDCYLWQLDGTTLVGNGFAGWTPGAAWRAAGIGDFNADGMADIVLQNNETGDCYLWLMNGGTAGTDALAGAGYVGWRPPSADWHVRDTGDYNGDTRSDILLQDSVTGDCFAWLLDGTNVIGGGYVGWRPGAAWVAQRGGDMNGDGNADVLLRNSDTGESYVWQLDGTTVTGGGFVGWATSNEWQALG